MRYFVCLLVMLLTPALVNAQLEVDVQNQMADRQQCQEVLETRVSMFYDETPFIDVMDEIRDTFHMNMILDQSARDDSLTADEPITISLRGVKMGVALRMLLAERNATFVLDQNVLRIISLDVANDPSYFTTRIVNCKELIEVIQANSRRTVSKAYFVDPKNRVFANRLAPGPFSIQGNEIEELEKEQSEGEVKAQLIVYQPRVEENLISAIKTSIAPDDWDDTNGDGSLWMVGDCLVVNQTEEVAGQIERFLDDLKATMMKPKE